MRDLEQMVKERDEMIIELKMVTDAPRLDEQASQLQQQRASLDQRYNQTISKLRSHNEVMYRLLCRLTVSFFRLFAIECFDAVG